MECEEDNLYNNRYYKKSPDNDFIKFSTYGLNIEGIKKYIVPSNEKYNHMVRMNKDLEIQYEENKKIHQKRQEKLAFIDRYNEYRLVKNYTRKKIQKNEEPQEDPNKFQKSKLFTEMVETNQKIAKEKKEKNILTPRQIEKNNNPIKIQSEGISNIYKRNPLFNSQNNSNIHYTNFYNKYSKEYLRSRKNKSTSDYGRISRSINKNNFGKTMSFSKGKTTSRSLTKLSLPNIQPRKIIINYCSYYGGNVIDKTIGKNSMYMGDGYNPENFGVPSKNRTQRNVFGGLYLH